LQASKLGFREDAPGDGFAMEKAAVAGERFEGVSEGMAEVEDFAEAGFAFVAADDGGFGGDAARDDEVERGRVAAKESVEAILEIAVEGRVADDGVFDDFIKPGAVLARGKSAERVRINGDEAGLIEGADEVLAFGEVDAGLAADGAINLSDERGGDVDEGDAAQVAGGDKAGDVADHSAADGDEKGAAVGAGADQSAGERFDGAEGFRAFAVVEEEDAAGVRSKAGEELATAVSPDAR